MAVGRLADKTAIVTGGGFGIGKGIARAFAEEGARVVIASRNRHSLESTADEIRAQGATVLVAPTDVTDEAQVMALFERTVEEFGRLDILVNNAGAEGDGPLEELSLETWRRVIDTLLTGAFLCSREAMKVMKRQRAGRIINIGSIAAQMARMNAVPYVTAKHGLVGLTKATALEGRDYGVVASCLHPGLTATGRVPPASDIGEEQMMAPEDIASAAVTMAALPPNVNMLEAIVLPVVQPYLGRG